MIRPSSMVTVTVAALAFWSTASQAAVVNQVQADLGLISVLPYSRHFGTTFADDGIGGYTTVSSSGGTVTEGGIDGSVVTRPLVSQPGSASFNFYDDHLFTTGGAGGTLTAATLSIGFQGQGIEHLQVRLYELGGDGLTTGDPSGEVTHGWLLSSLSGGVLMSQSAFETPLWLKANTAYTLEVRGLVVGTTASYGGNLSIGAVPEASSWLIALVGLGCIAGLGAQARRTPHDAGITPG